MLEIILWTWAIVASLLAFGFAAAAARKQPERTHRTRVWFEDP